MMALFLRSLIITHFFLKGHYSYNQQFENLGLCSITIEKGLLRKELNYYEITPEIWKNKQELTKLTHKVIDTSLLEQNRKSNIRESRLKDLPNMNFSLEKLLARNGVPDVNAFKEIGCYEAFHRLKKASKNISDNILFSLFCALKTVHVQTLTDEEKDHILEHYKNSVRKTKFNDFNQ